MYALGCTHGNASLLHEICMKTKKRMMQESDYAIDYRQPETRQECDVFSSRQQLYLCKLERKIWNTWKPALQPWIDSWRHNHLFWQQRAGISENLLGLVESIPGQLAMVVRTFLDRARAKKRQMATFTQ
jgi:hypothetical protein